MTVRSLRVAVLAVNLSCAWAPMVRADPDPIPVKTRSAPGSARKTVKPSAPRTLTLAIVAGFCGVVGWLVLALRRDRSGQSESRRLHATSEKRDGA
jgi:hypothetical protein